MRMILIYRFKNKFEQRVKLVFVEKTLRSHRRADIIRPNIYVFWHFRKNRVQCKRSFTLSAIMWAMRVSVPTVTASGTQPKSTMPTDLT